MIALPHAGPHFFRRPRFIVDAAVFDGTNDYLTRGGELTGLSDGKAGTVSFWLLMNGGDGVAQRVISSTNARFTVARSAGNQINVTGRSSVPGVVLENRSTSTIVAATGWTHVMASWDLAASASSMWFDGVQETLATDTKVDTAIDYTDTEFSIGGHTAGTLLCNASIADLWFAGSYIDLTVAANRLKFLRADGKPEFLGDDGSIPLGTAPAVYCRLQDGEAASAFAVNRGAGGGFTVTGALTSDATSPSD